MIKKANMFHRTQLTLTNHHVDCCCKAREERGGAPLVKNRRGRQSFDLSARRLNVDVNLLLVASAKQPAPENKKQHQDDNYEDRQHRDNARASTATTILSHEGFLLFKGKQCWGLSGKIPS